MGVIGSLKPCPFCGGKGATEPHFYEGYDEEDNLCELVDYFVHCTKCGVSTPFLSCEEAAQDAWEERYITPSADGYTSSVTASVTPSPTGEGEGVSEAAGCVGDGGRPMVAPTGEAVQVCCHECEHLERVNGRIVDARCKVTGVSFPKYATERALITPATFSCSEAKPKGGYGK